MQNEDVYFYVNLQVHVDMYSFVYVGYYYVNIHENAELFCK